MDCHTEVLGSHMNRYVIDDIRKGIWSNYSCVQKDLLHWSMPETLNERWTTLNL